MERRELEAMGAICVMAALADGDKSGVERERIRSVLEGLGGEAAKPMATACKRVLLQETTLEEEVRALQGEPMRRLAFEMAVAVCDADGAHDQAEAAFLERLRALVGLPQAEAASVVRDADALATSPLAPPPLPAVAAAGSVVAVAPPPLPVSSGASVANVATRDAEIDSTVLKYAILAGGLELLPQTMATMAIVPLQMKMVHGVGKSCGVSLDRGSIKEMLGVVGVGAASQVVESFARELVGGLAKKFLGKKAAKVAGVATGAGMTFATTWALGMVAKQYYAGGRKLSSIDLRALFGRELERAKALYPAHQRDIERSARETDASSLLGMLRGG
ncbi:MAG: YcjF family protein [Planctomycetia bacterium]|jgi:uncharacterized protein (DUF697 family)/tellurite resistance protein